MANGFLSLLPFRPNRSSKMEQKPPTRILPAEDILDFEYPPESRFNRQSVDSDEQDLMAG